MVSGLGYNLDEPLPDHSSLTRVHMRYGLEIFHRIFEAIIEQCQQAELIWGRKLYFDATPRAGQCGARLARPLLCC